MPWNKIPEFGMPLQPASKWTERVRSVDPVDDAGSQRVSIVEKDCIEVNMEQLDPRIVTLESLIKDGVKIEPGNVRNMLDLTDPADIERYNSLYVSDAYKWLQENKDKIFKDSES